MTPTVLHIQTGDGTSGGIAGYISALIKCEALSNFRQAVIVPGLASHRQRALQLYNDAELVSLPETYSAATVQRYLRRLSITVRAVKPAIIHAHALRSALAATATSHIHRTPIVYTNHGLRYSQKNGALQKNMFKQIDRFVCSSAAAVVSVRPSDHTLAVSDSLAPSERLYMIPTQLALPKHRPRPEPRSRPLLLGIGSLIEVKRPDLFLQWIGALHKRGITFDAIWAGDGPLRSTLETRARSLALNVRFTGHITPEEVRSYLSEASLLLMPSDFEVFPLAVLEAASCGVPAVIRPFRGADDVLEDGLTGMIVKEETPERAAQDISSLLENPNRLALLGSQARERYLRRFSNPEETAASYATVYNNALDGRARR